MGPRRFRKRPVVIQAVQWDDSTASLAELRRFAGDWVIGEPSDGELPIATLEDGSGALTVKHLASQGDWIIRGVQGEYYPCKPDIFAATYELVPEDDA
jgi:hypothetical protein